jgi:RimJ/RimL family protein N-acetyltransferase
MYDLELYTERLCLKPCTSSDLDPLHHLWTDQMVKQYLWDDEMISRVEAEQAIAASTASFAEVGLGQWVIRLKEQGQFIGLAGFVTPNHPFFDRDVLPEDREIVELIFAVLPDYRRHGYATEAVQAILEFGLTIVGGLTRVVAIADIPNVGSIQVLERVGLKQSGGRVIGGQEIVLYELERAGINRL